jgi:hypothetical protein
MSKVNFYNEEGAYIGAKKRPQSSKPPKFVTSYQGAPKDVDWDSEYEFHVK